MTSYAPHQWHGYSIQQTSPADSTANSPSNASPTSPRSHPHAQSQYQQFHAQPPRQLRPMKSPLYVPAALRPTEPARKIARGSTSASPMTPPKSLPGSLESLQDANQGIQPHVQAPAQDGRGRTISRDLADSAHDWIAGEQLGEVVGQPTKDHWKDDTQSPSCDSAACRNTFNLFRRRHHCRHCGHIFCAQHVPQTIPLDQQARFHPQGIPSRACDTCHRHYQKWEAARRLNAESRSNSARRSKKTGRVEGEDRLPPGYTDSSESHQHQSRRDDSDDEEDENDETNDPAADTPPEARDNTAGRTTTATRQNHHRNHDHRSGGGLISSTRNSESTVGSVPRDWAWSTF